MLNTAELRGYPDIRTETYGPITVEFSKFGSDVTPSNATDKGYTCYCVRISNSSPQQHKVTLTIPKDTFRDNSMNLTMKHSVVVAANSTVELPLYQPPVPPVGKDVQISIDDFPRADAIMFNFSHGSRSEAPIILISDSIKADLFDLMTNPPPSSKPKYSYSANTKKLQIESARFSAAMNTSWLAYSMYAAIVMTNDDFTRMKPETRNSVRDYVQCGGSLWIIGDWVPPAEWNYTTEKDLEHYRTGFGICKVSRDTSSIKSWKEAEWNSVSYRLFLSSFQTLSSSLSRESLSLAFFKDSKWLEIPVGRLFVLILFFAAIMGPVNVYILNKKGKSMWLYWTVPAISLTGCLAIMLFSFFMEGWTSTLKSESLSILDQKNHRSVTLGTYAYYCPLTPSDGLHFDHSTELTPATDKGYSYYRTSNSSNRNCELDTTVDQHLESGWILARDPSFFIIRKPQLCRKRLKFSRSAKDPEVLNGIGGRIAELYYLDLYGEWHHVKDIPPGAKTILKPFSFAGNNAITTIRKTFTFRGNPYLNNMVDNVLHSSFRRGSYIAILDSEPFIRKGIEKNCSPENRSVIIGYTGEDDYEN